MALTTCTMPQGTAPAIHSSCLLSQSSVITCSPWAVRPR
jgi:hypothetical protein